jgi:hypothetical protein
MICGLLVSCVGGVRSSWGARGQIDEWEWACAFDDEY